MKEMPLLRSLRSAFPFVHFLDAANVITAFNVALALTTIGLASRGNLRWAAAAIALAAALDFVDGHVARTWLSGDARRREFGKQLDSLADLLNFSAAPAYLLAFGAGTNTAAIAAAFLVLSGALRLAVFGASTPARPMTYSGLPTTYSGLLFALAYQAVAAGRIPASALIAPTVAIGALQLTALRIPKLKAPHAVAFIGASYVAETLVLHLL
jgi:CDP-diacylglycerol--serine O-phosphatidyltransferase